LVAVTCVASGTLECSAPSFTPAQHRGAQLYGRMCAICHGRTGDGYAADHAPALSHRDFLASVTDEYLHAAIANGRGGTTMSAWSTVRGGPLSPADVDAVVSFLRSWDVASRAKLDERPKGGDAARGAETFDRECLRCHGKNGTGGPEVHIGNSELLASASNGFLRYAIRGGRSGTPMPAFGLALGDGAIEDVVELLRAWQAKPAPLPRPVPAKTPPLPLGPVPLNPHGPEPEGFVAQGTGAGTTRVDAIKAQLDRGARMALLDARAPSDYMREHIAGAVSVPFYEPEPYISALPRDAWLVCYCACPHAESGQLAQKLVAKGFAKVTVLDEGLGVWRARKYPTQSGMDP
jgi:cytochrome c oxidase cbb3-type subunit 3/ubiquinol-cytochrome c reductase cytochrome c subunit